MNSGNFDLQKLREKFAKKKFSWRKIWKEIWPIDWSFVKKPKLVAASVSQASYFVKVVFVISLIGLLVSFGYFFYGIYRVSTVPVAAEGGDIREAVVGGEMTFFNPVLDRTNEAETKVVDLVYHPLYEIVYPDFMSGDEPQFPEIKPILLAEEPQWVDEDAANPSSRYKNLKFTLKEDIKWSDGSPITVEDIEYTFNRLRENKANTKFNEAFKKLSFKKISTNEFKLISSVSNPQLKYQADFRPISKDYYESQTIDRLWISQKSRKPTVTSGYFTFKEGEAKDPDSKIGEPIKNPVSEGQSDNYRMVILDKNPHQNTGEKIYVDRYIIKRYDDTTSKAGLQHNLEEDSKDGKVDLYTRFLGTNMNFSPSELKEEVGLDQKVVNTNTFYNVYFNMRPSFDDYTGYTVNPSLRKYISCHLLKYDPKGFDEYLDPISEEKKIVPIQLNAEASANCGDLDTILDDNYQINEIDNTKQVVFSSGGGGLDNFVMVGYQESLPLLQDLQSYFAYQIGVPVDLVTDPDAVDAAIKNHTYNAAVLPVTLLSQDPYSLFGEKGKDLSQHAYNSYLKETDYNVEENLDAYSLSNLSDDAARDALIKFFSEQYVTVNLFRVKSEYNYSPKLESIRKNLPNFAPSLSVVYEQIPNWYVETKRKARWNV